jgi:tRNA pseudouridine38-40 synthase
MIADSPGDTASDYNGRTRIALGIEYRGTGFCGWQIQPGVRTVQACVESALSRVADEAVRVICAGRTDTGVHALGQVVHFDTSAVRPARAWIFGANAHLPADVGVWWAQETGADFHARFSAARRRYRYVICNTSIRPAVLDKRVAWYFRPLDVAPMLSAAHDLVGEHDFSSYRSYACQAKHPVRTVYRLDVMRRDRFIVIDIVANAFLHHMVRNIAGVLMEIGSGRQAPGWAAEILAARDRTAGGVNAPPDGLYFIGAEYPGRYRIPPAPEGPGIW